MVDPIADYDAASALVQPRLTVQQYAEAWRVAHAARGFGPYNAAGYDEVLAEVRRKFRLDGRPISDELAARCKAYVDAMKRNKRRK